MFLNRNTLHTSFQGLVGAHQTINPEYPLLADSLLVSRSMRYWPDEHPLLTIENIDQCLTNYSHFNYTEYSALAEYSLYDKVQYNDVNYEYINAAPSTGSTPPNATYWKVIDDLSDYLLQIDYKSTDMVLDAVMNHKKIKGEVKSIFNNVLLFTGQAQFSDTITNSGSFVGLAIKLQDHRSLITIINRIGHQFDSTISDLTLYLYHTSQIDPLATYSIDHTKAKSSQWTTISDDNIMRFLSDDHDIGGVFLLGYYQDDLSTVKAIKKDISWDTYKSCCDVKKQYEEYAPFISVCGFSIQSTYLNGTDLPDEDVISYENYTNYGLNLSISTKCDLTPFVLENEDLISQVKSIQMAMLVLRDMAFNTRGSNSLANQVREQAKKELYSFKDAKGTVADRLNDAIMSLNFDLSGMNDACLPCTGTMSVNYISP